ncbi:S-adenosyl-L-methionine-dependent methyltransferase, partial [Schizothecium vesticola]
GSYLDEFICDDGLVIKAGVTVELSEPLTITGLAAPFLKVTVILDTGDGGAILRGVPFVRARHVKMMLARKINEVCMLVVVDNTQVEARHEVSADRVVRIRDLRMTNSAYPEHGYNTKDLLRRGKDYVLTHSPLVCRWKFVQIFDTSLARRKNSKPVEWELVRIQEQEADDKYRERSEFLVNKWRGGNITGGSYKTSGSEVPVIDLRSRTRRGQRQSGKVPLSPGQQYTAGDTFAGAGGASRGIELAGARLVFAVDHWDAAAKSLKANFAEDKTTVHTMDIYDFVTSPTINYRVDLLHLSPPCQVWSPAHTTPGQNDEMNEASLWSCTHIVNKVRPRLFTVEQTFGILAPRFQTHFGLFIAGFTDLGYSVRWKVINLKTFGLAQPRRRVIIFGAGPGEKLPPFPPPTHANGGAGGLKPLTTVRQVLRHVGRARNDPLHTPKPFDHPRTPWSPKGLLPNTMTCGGGQNYHWSGKRDFTLREYALLQGFPAFHQFEAPCIKKQIGNAFPPSVVKIFYTHLIAWLDKTDGADPSSR